MVREEVELLDSDFQTYFTERTGATGRIKFDITQNGGRVTFRLADGNDFHVWETQWRRCSDVEVYVNGGYVGVVAVAKFAEDLADVDEPNAVDHGDNCPPVEVGGVAVWRSEAGHALSGLRP